MTNKIKPSLTMSDDVNNCFVDHENKRIISLNTILMPIIFKFISLKDLT